MRFASLGSGSRGNGTVIAGANSCLLIDCGFGLRDVEARLAHAGLAPSDLSGILVTHEHSDHGQGVDRLAHRHAIPVYTTAGTARQLNLVRCRVELITPAQVFSVGGLQVFPVVVPHDARDPVQFVVSQGQRKVGVLTDAGHVTPHMLQAYAQCDALMVECNHDADLLWAGRYPEPLKRRVAGLHGHLNNHQAASFIGALASQRLQALVLAHLSEQNNSMDHALTAAQDVLCAIGVQPPILNVATQSSGCAWITLN